MAPAGGPELNSRSYEICKQMRLTPRGSASPQQVRGRIAKRSNQIGVLHFIAADDEGSFLIGTVPVWKRSANDVKAEGSGSSDVVGAKIGDVSSNHGLALFWSGLCPVGGRKFRQIAAHGLRGKVAAGVEYKHANRMRTEDVGLVLILRRNKHPSSDELVLGVGCLLLGCRAVTEDGKAENQYRQCNGERATGTPEG
jgi:hypothetical protein